jgi:hypothetical protein
VTSFNGSFAPAGLSSGSRVGHRQSAPLKL